MLHRSKLGELVRERQPRLSSILEQLGPLLGELGSVLGSASEVGQDGVVVLEVGGVGVGLERVDEVAHDSDTGVRRGNRRVPTGRADSDLRGEVSRQIRPLWFQEQGKN